MSPIEKAARSLCRVHGEQEDDVSTGTPRWAAYLPQVMVVIDALHEPSLTMRESGLEIIRDVGMQSDAANVWRFMIDVLRQDVRHAMASVAIPDGR
ncbi:hypothetical protein ACT9ST_26785 (plasmid) [Sphingobium limneticum]|jgi:hypothetical protein